MNRASTQISTAASTGAGPGPSDRDVLVIGAGPAGLAAAEAASAIGARVHVIDAMPSVGRKFLMAGKSGLNLTKAQDLAAFQAAYACPQLADMIAQFGPDAVQSWAQSLGQPVFTGSSGRVFPTAMKASPLLRAWLSRLNAQGVTFATRTRWTGWAEGGVQLATSMGPQTLRARAVVLALGGASWARLGSDGAWAAQFSGQTTPFAPTNMGVLLDWSAPLQAHAGAALKPVGLRIGTVHVVGECVLSATGLEGSAVYALSRAARGACAAGEGRIWVDLTPTRSQAALAKALSRPKGKQSWASYLRKSARLDGVKRALLFEGGPPPADPDALAAHIKAVPLRLTGLAPLDQAISVAGGLRWDHLDQNLGLRDRPGVFAAGEMLDWEAPTGGYLITACLATGRWAGRAAAHYAAARATV
ncbi:MAG: TIGR03862 family flavoprotein [Pseudomonadota bacterium]